MVVRPVGVGSALQAVREKSAATMAAGICAEPAPLEMLVMMLERARRVRPAVRARSAVIMAVAEAVAAVERGSCALRTGGRVSMRVTVARAVRGKCVVTTAVARAVEVVVLARSVLRTGRVSMKAAVFRTVPGKSVVTMVVEALVGLVTVGCATTLRGNAMTTTTHRHRPTWAVMVSLPAPHRRRALRT